MFGFPAGFFTTLVGTGCSQLYAVLFVELYASGHCKSYIGVEDAGVEHAPPKESTAV